MISHTVSVSFMPPSPPSYAFARIPANAPLLLHYCVLMVSRNGVTRQFSLFSSTASLYPTLLPFRPFLLHLSFHPRLTFCNAVFLPASTRSWGVSFPFYLSLLLTCSLSFSLSLSGFLSSLARKKFHP